MMNTNNCSNAYNVRRILRKKGIPVVADNYHSVEARMLLDEIELSPALDNISKAQIVLDDIKVFYNGEKEIMVRRPPHIKACAFSTETGGIIVSLERLTDYNDDGVYTFAGITLYLYGEIPMDLIENVYIEGRGGL